MSATWIFGLLTLVPLLVVLMIVARHEWREMLALIVIGALVVGWIVGASWLATTFGR